MWWCVLAKIYDKNNDDNISLPLVYFLSTEQLVEDSNTSGNTVNKQEKEWIKLFEASNTDESNLSTNETGLLKQLVRVPRGFCFGFNEIKN